MARPGGRRGVAPSASVAQPARSEDSTEDSTIRSPATRAAPLTRATKPFPLGCAGRNGRYRFSIA
jgi:hypothetical protein